MIISSAAGGAYWPIAIRCPSLHRRWCPSASHHPLTFLFLLALTFPLPFPCHGGGQHGGGRPVRLIAFPHSRADLHLRKAKGRAANGKRPVGAAGCRREQQIQSDMPNPPEGKVPGDAVHQRLLTLGDPEAPGRALVVSTLHASLFWGRCRVKHRRRRRGRDAKGQKQHLCADGRLSHSHLVEILYPCGLAQAMQTIYFYKLKPVHTPGSINQQTYLAFMATPPWCPAGTWMRNT